MVDISKGLIPHAKRLQQALSGENPLKTVKNGSEQPAYDVGPLAGKPIPGMVQKGNIDVNHRPQIHNDDGSMSSIYSMTIPIDKDGSPWPGDYDKAPSYALVPSIANGKFLTPNGKIPNEDDRDAKSALEDAATQYYGKTREHLGIFKSADAADKYATATHAWGNDGTDTEVYAPSYKGDSNLVINPGPQTAAPTGTTGGALPLVRAAVPVPMGLQGGQQ